MQNLKIQTQDSFEVISKKLNQIFRLPHSTNDEINEVLAQLTEIVHEFDLAYLSISVEMNTIHVQRALITGHICNYVKGKLLHGNWTSWVVDHFTEGQRSLEKFMAIARSEERVGKHAHLGTEKVYQLTRIEHLLREDNSFEGLFSDVGLDTNLKEYNCKAFETSVKIILNKQTLSDYGIEINNESLGNLSENFNLIRNNNNVLTRLTEGKDEGADLDKTVNNMIANLAGKRTPQKKTKSSKNKQDVNHAAESFIRIFQEAISDQDMRKQIIIERIQFITKLISEYYEAIDPSKQ